jgi:hypothetical protein
MDKHTKFALAAAVLVALVGSGPAQAQTAPQPAVLDRPSNPIGKVVAVVGTASIERANATVVQANVAGQAGQPKAGDLVYQGDVVKTGSDSRISINFADGSSFNLSSNARMALDEFVYDPNGKSNSTFFNLTNGTATFVAGSIAKTGGMKVDTPVATMGIRGTTPHIEISNDGEVKFSTLVEEGKSQLAKRPGPAAAHPPEQREKFNPKICRGC